MSEVLTIYFSRNGKNWSNGRVVDLEKGNTEVAAEAIRAAVGGDLFKVETIEGYSDDYKKCSEEARKEYDEDARPALKEYLTGADKYDIVFVCYPNWFGTMPMAMYTQLERLNLAGKKIAPLCTNEGSGLGESENELKRICKGAKVLPGLSVHGSGVAKIGHLISDWATASLTREPEEED